MTAVKILKKTLAKIMLFALIAGIALPVGFFTAVPISHAATIEVLNTNASGADSLDAAITTANANGGTDTITFNAALSGTITLTGLLTVTDDLIIDGTTANDTLVGPDIIIDAGNALANAMRFTDASNHTVKGIGFLNGTSAALLIDSVSAVTIGGTGADDGNTFDGNPGSGIKIEGGSNDITILGNKIGETAANGIGIEIDTATDITIGDATGTVRNYIVNSTGDGIIVSNLTDGAAAIDLQIQATTVGINSSDVTAANGDDGIVISNTNAGAIYVGSADDDSSVYNVISGNTGDGVEVTGDDVIVSGNYIGLNAAGTAAVANGANGVYINGASDTSVQGARTNSTTNVISGNTLDGIKIVGGDSNSISYSTIGMNATQAAAIPNGQDGIYIEDSTDSSISNSRISGNTGDGVEITGTSTGATLNANYMGLDAWGTTAIANGGHGINISSASVTVGSSTGLNKISGNTGNGINVSAGASQTIVNNYIGCATDGTTVVANDGDAIYMAGNSVISSSIGGTTADDANVICVASGAKGVNLAGAGAYNLVRKNNFKVETNGLYTPVAISAGSNEDLATPVITSSTSSRASGTACATCTVDLYDDGTWITSATADAVGAWEAHAYFDGSELFATATNASNSTSGSTAFSVISADVSLPTSPTVTSDLSATNVMAYIWEGTKDSYTSVEDNNVEIVAIDSSETWTYGENLSEGQNLLTVTTVDYSSNSSSEVIIYSKHYDPVAPTDPTLSYSSTSSSYIAEISGSGTEAGASIYADDILAGSADGYGDFSITVSLAAGTNTLAIKAVDAAGNESSEVSAVITAIPSGGGGSGGGSSSSSSSSTTTTDDSDDDTAEDAADETADVNEPVEEATETPTVDTTPVEIPVIDTTPVVEAIRTADTTTETSEETTTTTEETTATEEASDSDETATAEDTPTPVQAAYYEAVENVLAALDLDESIAAEVALDESIAKDTDGDGIPDYVEVYEQGTDPGDYDSDGDGQADSVDANPSNYDALAFDTSIVDGTADTDGDGLSNQVESALGTDPNDADSDDDGLTDGAEATNYGTDPNDPTSQTQATDLSIANFQSGGGGTNRTATGQQSVMGRAEADVPIYLYLVDENGDTELVGKTVSDENGLYNILTDELEAGTHTLVAVSGEEGKNKVKDIQDVSQVVTLDVQNQTSVPTPQINIQKTAAEETGAAAASEGDTLTLNFEGGNAGKALMVTVTWQSTVLSQTFIADINEEGVAQVSLKRPASLENGDHTVTVSASDPETGEKGAAQQLSFEVSTVAFATGDTGGGSPLGVVVGGIAILAFLTALAIFMRKRKNVKS